MKPQFTLPNTPMSVVIFNKDGKNQEVVIDTPRSNDNLFQTMLGYQVGYSQIRAVKSLDANELMGKMAFQPKKHRNK